MVRWCMCVLILVYILTDIPKGRIIKQMGLYCNYNCKICIYLSNKAMQKKKKKKFMCGPNICM